MALLKSHHSSNPKMIMKALHLAKLRSPEMSLVATVANAGELEAKQR